MLLGEVPGGPLRGASGVGHEHFDIRDGLVQPAVPREDGRRVLDHRIDRGTLNRNGRNGRSRRCDQCRKLPAAIGADGVTPGQRAGRGRRQAEHGLDPEVVPVGHSRWIHEGVRRPVGLADCDGGELPTSGNVRGAHGE